MTDKEILCREKERERGRRIGMMMMMILIELEGFLLWQVESGEIGKGKNEDESGRLEAHSLVHL